MAAVSLLLPDDVSRRLEKLVDLAGRSKTFYMVSDHIDELEELYLADHRLTDLRAGRSRTFTLEEVERNLGQWIEVEAEAMKDPASTAGTGGKSLPAIDTINLN